MAEAQVQDKNSEGEKNSGDEKDQHVCPVHGSECDTIAPESFGKRCKGGVCICTWSPKP